MWRPCNNKTSVGGQKLRDDTVPPVEQIGNEGEHLLVNSDLVRPTHLSRRMRDVSKSRILF